MLNRNGGRGLLSDSLRDREDGELRSLDALGGSSDAAAVEGKSQSIIAAEARRMTHVMLVVGVEESALSTSI